MLTRRANRRPKQSEVKKKRPWGTQFNSYYSQTQAYHFIKTSTHHSAHRLRTQKRRIVNFA
uniref:Uncharacterized protein n=1 Tax=Onchocerca volvulus TaxID=6282 RepID=A0A8R1XXH2_ONCVO